MQRHLLQRLVVWLAFAAALLVPLTAQAFVPTCEDVEATVLQRDPPSHVVDDGERCAIPPGEGDDLKIAAMCDARGLSIVAPQRILPIADARIDAARSCTSLESGSPAIGPSPDDAAGAGGPSAAVSHSVLAANGLVLPAPSELGPAFLPVEGSERAGVEPKLERPPC